MNMADDTYIRDCEGYDTSPVLLPRPDGTAAIVDAGAVRALVGYVEQRAGIADVLGCGCTNRVECGYHREQAERVAPCWQPYDCNHDRCWELRRPGRRR